ncbi:hepatic lectin-like [Pristis pectinata]|uniref:hepatic lectin-like n=1 Tax=Pristis pectinata TaxID=685728 RepID=UPI00223D0572|nr:hepatic lectin-like [Pristis pectinata]
MELNADYQNIDEFNPEPLTEHKRSPVGLKPDRGVRAAESAGRKQSHSVTYALLSLSLLLAVLTLGITVTLIALMSSEFKKSDVDFRMEFSQWKNNVTGNFEKIRSALANLSGEISVLSDLTSCPKQWTRFKRNCYTFSSSEKTWFEAQSSCESMNANLVVINSAEEQEFLTKKLKNYYYWIGLNDLTYEGDWRWLDGTNYSSSLTFWQKGEPNDKNNEDCAEMLSHGLWNDQGCNVPQHWICEKPVH